MNIGERMRKNLEEFKKKVKENPRYAIESKADKEGNMKVYFSPKAFVAYMNGNETIGSTERFFPNDIIHKVPVVRVEAITDGGTIVHINKLSI